ncbi:DUF2244 domain-containing protein [Glycocaulis profundi]|nr:DUF2244 domain-containing protein [Glycocaulis profundi]
MARQPAHETWPADAHGRAADGEPEPLADMVFDARIRPNRSLGSAGFLILMGVLIAVSFTAGIAFVSVGAWPVFGYFGLDVILVWLLFRLSYRDGRRLEIVRVTPTDIHIARRWPNGWETRYRMPSAWTKVELRAAGKPEVQTRLTAMGKALHVGAMLSPKERESLAAALEDALVRAKALRGPQETGGEPSPA